MFKIGDLLTGFLSRGGVYIVHYINDIEYINKLAGVYKILTCRIVYADSMHIGQIINKFRAHICFQKYRKLF